MINWHSIILVAVAAVITFLLRAFPFMIFSGNRKMPDGVKKVADLLPAAIMGVLVIYCVGSDMLSITTGFNSGVMATIVSLAAVIGVHVWKRNTLLSIGVGTVLYMVLIRVIQF